MTWLKEFAAATALSDKLDRGENHLSLLAAGLFGEAGSILSEHKKKERDGESYVAFRSRISEEIGDFLWYYVRLVTLLDPELLLELDRRLPHEARKTVKPVRLLASEFELGAAVGELLAAFGRGTSRAVVFRAPLQAVWSSLIAVSDDVQVSLEAAAKENQNKVASRWPAKRVHAPWFDDEYPKDEQLPRHFCVAFREVQRGGQSGVAVTLCEGGGSVGQILTDNIRDPDGYRFHDVFHFGYAACLGWSPVTRALLRCKRKSKPEVDEAEDGARAATIEEAVTALVFSRAKRLSFFERTEQLDYDLLKTVRGTVQGFEVDSVPLWQWEEAILMGYRVFRLLRAHSGGDVTIDLPCHQLLYSNPKQSLQAGTGRDTHRVE
jgi:NTP pyrophosphatase (non-canonical NTP hydrolase)